ncbi:MAG TPA: EamA family transporter [Cryomorphaceae bacterium]|nr:EamA family transporter [Cryomorphaceae bacterium]HCY25629.1 EamA family transporter [Cryomorphaceae bacterium]|tara:strand:- start:2281 stop:3219 length:939 start_codon:yes stop_codon:yes gene_type:complete
MQTHIKDQINLHFIVFVWGFTAILGKFISIDALALVFNRTAITSVAIGLYLLLRRKSFQANSRDLLFMWLCGVLIAVHWITFFGAIKIANISITLAGISTGALWTALLNPILTKSKIDWTELGLGLLVILGIVIVFYEEPNSASLERYSLGSLSFTNFQIGLIIALFSAMLSASFSILNKKLVSRYPRPIQVTFWELSFAFLSILIYQLIFGTDTLMSLWASSYSNLLFLAILALLCTAYPFIKSVELLKRMSPFSVMLAINLEPVYGILLAALFFGATESMNPQFYIGVVIILTTVIANGIIKARKRQNLS